MKRQPLTVQKLCILLHTTLYHWNLWFWYLKENYPQCKETSPPTEYMEVYLSVIMISSALSAIIYLFDLRITPLIPWQIMNAHNTQIERKRTWTNTYRKVILGLKGKPNDNIKTDIYPFKRCETSFFLNKQFLPKGNQMVRLAYFTSAENGTSNQWARVFSVYCK